MNKTKTLDITADVKWIGICDPDIKTFDIVMETKYGTTYNSYLINAEKVAIVETAKEKFKDDYLAKVTASVDPTKIEYIIVDHTEPDHSGCVRHLLNIAPNAKVVGSGNAIRYLNDIVGFEFPHIIVKDGDTISLGNKSLRFISAPNLHWPDSIYTYLEEDKLLFTCDSFGAHYCHEEMFDDLVGNFDDAFKYYFDVILGPFSKFMLKAIDKIRPLEINAILTGHGPILRSNWKKYVDISEEYAKQHIQNSTPVKNSVLVAYVSAYGYTSMIADKIVEGLRSAGIENVEKIDIEKADMGEVAAKVASSAALLVGSPTLNQNILPQIYTLFAYINPIRDKGKLGGAFGSYGWSGEGVGHIESALKSLKLKVEVPGLAVKFNPHDDTVTKAIEFGKVFGVKVLESCAVAE